MIKTILERITPCVVIWGVLGLVAAAMIYTLLKFNIRKRKMEIVQRFLQDPRVTKVQFGDCCLVERVLEKKGFNTGVTVAKHIEENYSKPKNRDGDELSTIV